MAEYDITAQITSVLSQYTGEVMDKVDKAVEYCGKGLRTEIAVRSPTRTGRYRGTWCCSIRHEGRGEKQSVVYNKENYQLTHLLENPHKKRGGKGLVDPQPHIGPAEENWTKKFEQMCEEACKAK